jgi:hypothetical protein
MDTITRALNFFFSFFTDSWQACVAKQIILTASSDNTNVNPSNPGDHFEVAA